MNKQIIDQLVREDKLRIREIDIVKVRSIIELAQTNAKVIKTLQINKDSATVVFTEIYESIHKLGDAQWWSLGYEPKNHEVSMDILQEMDIKDKLLLNHLPRFKKIRHDANYRGFKVNIQPPRVIPFAILLKTLISIFFLNFLLKTCT